MKYPFIGEFTDIELIHLWKKAEPYQEDKEFRKEIMNELKRR